MRLTSTLTLTSLVSIALAATREYYGTLSITAVDKSFVDRSLNFVNGTLREGEYATFFARDDGRIESYFSDDTLAVDVGKKISISDHEGANVLLAKKVSQDKWSLQANGATVFQRCGDGSIGLDSDCQGAERVYLHFSSMLKM